MLRSSGFSLWGRLLVVVLRLLVVGVPLVEELRLLVVGAPLVEELGLQVHQLQ